MICLIIPYYSGILACVCLPRLQEKLIAKRIREDAKNEKLRKKQVRKR